MVDVFWGALLQHLSRFPSLCLALVWPFRFYLVFLSAPWIVIHFARVRYRFVIQVWIRCWFDFIWNSYLAVAQRVVRYFCDCVDLCREAMKHFPSRWRITGSCRRSVFGGDTVEWQRRIKVFGPSWRQLTARLFFIRWVVRTSRVVRCVSSSFYRATKYRLRLLLIPGGTALLFRGVAGTYEIIESDWLAESSYRFVYNISGHVAISLTVL